MPGTPTTSSLWLFQLDNETKSLHEKWLEITKHMLKTGWLSSSRCIYNRQNPPPKMQSLPGKQYRFRKWDSPGQVAKKLYTFHPGGNDFHPEVRVTWRMGSQDLDTWLINNHGLSPKNQVVGPLPNGRTPWLIDGCDPNSLSRMILQHAQVPKIFWGVFRYMSHIHTAYIGEDVPSILGTTGMFGVLEVRSKPLLF